MEHFIRWHMLVELYSHMNRTMEQQSLRPLEWFGQQNILDTICMDTSVTNHEAIKSTSQPSGKLVRWALILQEMDLEIKYTAGKKNSNADALSRYPIDVPPAHDANTELSEVVATLDSSGEVGSKDGENALHDRQMSDSLLKTIVDYISDGKLPEDEKEAQYLTLRSQKFTESLESDKTLSVVVP